VRRFRLVMLAFVVLLALPAATVRAADRMQIGFYDDLSFRYAADRLDNLAAAAATGASIIHTNASWAAIAPTKPANAADASDPAYHLSDLDDLIAKAAQDGLRVMIDVSSTPKWANGGKTPNYAPTRPSDLTAFTRMLATRYNGRPGSLGSVSLWSVWNEPNLGQFLLPQYAGKKIVSPSIYARIYKAAYAGIKAGNPTAKVAIGETSAQGRDHPAARGVSDTVAPGTFARLLAQQKGLLFAAWAHHPYPTTPSSKPLQKVRYPNVTLSQLGNFEKTLKAAFKRTVPIWITEYGHETKPGEPKGVTYAQQAAYAKLALKTARADPNVAMFIWFTFRDAAGNPWQSGLEQPSGAPKPAYGAFRSLASSFDGQTIVVRPGRAPRLTVYVPKIAYFTPAGAVVGVSYRVLDGTKIIAGGIPTAALGTDQSVTFTPAFTPAKGHHYTVTANVNDISGNTETETLTVLS